MSAGEFQKSLYAKKITPIKIRSNMIIEKSFNFFHLYLKKIKNKSISAFSDHFSLIQSLFYTFSVVLRYLCWRWWCGPFFPFSSLFFLLLFLPHFSPPAHCYFFFFLNSTALCVNGENVGKNAFAFYTVPSEIESHVRIRVWYVPRV